MNENLPNFVVLITKDQKGQPLVSRLWGSGFLPGKHDGVQFRPDKDAVLYLNNPEGLDPRSRRRMLDSLEELHRIQLEKSGDTALETRVAQYEMGFRMQASIPEVTDLSSESDATFALYGEDARNPGTFAATCLMARRLAERGVQFIQLYHNIVEGGVHVHDFHATLLHLLGVDHEQLTFQFQGRHFRLTDVHGHVVKEILA